MAYDYTAPQSTVFGFIIFTFVVSIIHLTITKDGSFKTAPAYLNFTSACLAFAVYIFPAMIYIRVALSEGSPGPAEPRHLLFAEFGISLGLLILSLICWLVKFCDPITRKANLSDLHYISETHDQSRENERPLPISIRFANWIRSCKSCFCQQNQQQQNRTYFQVYVQYDEESAELPRTQLKPCKGARPDDKKLADLKYLCDHPIYWRFTIAYFFFRFLLMYGIYIPFSIGCNLYVAIKYNHPVMGFDEIIFWISFGIAQIVVTGWLCCELGYFQAYAHFVLILNSVIICYFIADTPYLVNLLLASLTLYLSTTYDTIKNLDVPKNYKIPQWWCFQAKCCARQRLEVKEPEPRPNDPPLVEVKVQGNLKHPKATLRLQDRIDVGRGNPSASTSFQDRKTQPNARII